jgi:hypothetical protein
MKEHLPPTSNNVGVLHPIKILQFPQYTCMSDPRHLEWYGGNCRQWSHLFQCNLLCSQTNYFVVGQFFLVPTCFSALIFHLNVTNKKSYYSYVTIQIIKFLQKCRENIGQSDKPLLAGKSELMKSTLSIFCKIPFHYCMWCTC